MAINTHLIESPTAHSQEPLREVMRPDDSLNTAIETHPFLAGLKPEHLSILTENAQRATFAPGQIIFREQEPANQFYLIQSSAIAIQTKDLVQDSANIQILGAGEVLGWSWLFQPFAWHFTAQALRESTAIVLDGGRMLASAERDHDFGYELMKQVSRLVIQRLQATRKHFIARESRLASTYHE
jgi:CRP-like cAMP-binding protein